MRWTEDLNDERSVGSSIGYVDLDGLVQENRFLHQGKSKVVLSGQQISPTTQRLFRFSSLVRAAVRLFTPASDV